MLGRNFGVLVAFVFAFMGLQPALSHDFIVNRLAATCTNPGDSASAEFVTVPQTHGMALKLVGTGTGQASGSATFSRTIFQSTRVRFKGACSKDFKPASLITHMIFLPPNSTQVLDHGYDCARNIGRVFPDGTIEVLITHQSLCDCGDHIPPGSKLLGIDIVLACDDEGGDGRFQDLVTGLVVNDHPIPFDFHARSAVCANQ